MGRLLTATCIGTALLLTHAAGAAEFDLSVDLRAVSTDATPTRLSGGLGKLRYDEQHDGLRLGYLRLGYRLDLTQTLRITAEGVAYGDHDVNALDLTEIFAEWRPIPASAWRSSLKLGAFYPEISLENRMRGWRSPYTLSFSALNTWVGEELRTMGAEYRLEWLGRSNGRGFDVSFNGALYGWNDTAGTVLASRGWGLHDRQSTLFGRFANRGQPNPERTLFFDDLDKRAGYYVGTTAKYRGLLEARMMYYDNRARLGPDNTRIEDDPWHTRFESVGVRSTPTAELTMITQWLHGRSFDDIAVPTNAWSFDAEFLLASWKQGAMRYSTRYDRFASQQTASNFAQYVNGIYYGDRGHAWTLAASRQFNEHWSTTLEAIEVRSSVAQRALIWANGGTQATERQWQLAVRYDR
jgi:hypothetical protein